MSPGIHVWLRNAAAVIFSTAISFLFMALVWQVCRGLPPNIAVFAAIAAISILVAAMYASINAGAELNWSAVSRGWATGSVTMGGWWLTQTSLPFPVPYTILIPLTLSSLTVAATVERLPSQESPHFYNTARFVSVVHLLQGIFLFGIALPGSIAWRWPRPFAAALIYSAFALWTLWRGCPLTMAENKLRVREGKVIIPPNEGFIKDLCARWGIPVSGKAVAAGLHAIGISLCCWWGIEWLMSLIVRG